MFIPPTVLYHSSAVGIWPRIVEDHADDTVQQRDLRHLRLKALRSLMEAADESGLTDDVAFHCVQNLGARRRCGQIQLGVERIELKHIVMKRPGTGARPEISSPADIRGGLLCAIRQISHRKAFL